MVWGSNLANVNDDNGYYYCFFLTSFFYSFKTWLWRDCDSHFLMQVVLIHVGVTSVIAHIKIGQMHAALESKVLVVSAQGQSTLCLPIRNIECCSAINYFVQHFCHWVSEQKKKKSADFTNKTSPVQLASYVTTTSRKWFCVLAAFTINCLCSYCSKTKIMIRSRIKETWYEQYRDLCEKLLFGWVSGKK